MQTAPSTNSREQLTLSRVHVSAPCEAYLIPVSKFPIPQQELASLAKLWDALTSAAMETWHLKPHTFIQLEQLNQRPGRNLFIEKAAEWIPEVGLGVWPDRNAPAVWTPEELMSTPRGQKPRPLSYQVFQITTSEKSKLEACAVIREFGPVMQMLSLDDAKGLLSKTAAEFLPAIEDPTFRSFLFYVPLIDQKTLAKSGADDLPRWLCGSTLYIRESFEDSGVLVISTRPLASLLTGTGLMMEQINESQWMVR